jgi:two-component system, OmpR family, response regulator
VTDSNLPSELEPPAVKNVYTTGEVAQICKVSQQTVIRCFDSGRLKGFRVPGSKFRRIPRDCLMQFMKENGIPLDSLESGKKRVLVVDDDEAIVEMLTELLERDGRFEVRTASSGYDAGLLTHEFRPDIIILDFKLPDVNGNVVCRTLRSNPAFEHIKIIIISGVVDKDEIEELMAAGADDFLQKPFQIDELLARMVQLVNV